MLFIQYDGKKKECSIHNDPFNEVFRTGGKVSGNDLMFYFEVGARESCWVDFNYFTYCAFREFKEKWDSLPSSACETESDVKEIADECDAVYSLCNAISLEQCEYVDEMIYERERREEFLRDKYNLG